MLRDPGVDDAEEDALFLDGGGVAEKCRVFHLFLIHHPLPVEIHEEIGLHHDIGDAGRKRVKAAAERGLLDADGQTVGARFPGHLESVTGDGRRGEVEEILPEAVAGLFADQIRIAGSPAASENDGLAVDDKVPADLVGREKARDFSVRVHEDLLSHALIIDSDAELLGPLRHLLIHQPRRGGTDLFAGLYDVPGRLGFREVAESALEFDAHALKPLDGVGALPEVAPEQSPVDVVMLVLHHHLHRFFNGEIDAGFLLIVRLDCENPHPGISETARNGSLLKNGDMNAFFCSGDCGCQTCRTSGDDNKLDLIF